MTTFSSEPLTTPEQRRILRHMLGINDGRKARPEAYRDYYCANLGNKKLLEMEAMGLVSEYRRDTYAWYTTTELGEKIARQSFAEIRHSPARRRYSKFLEIKDALPDLTFREFLTSDRFRESRAA